MNKFKIKTYKRFPALTEEMRIFACFSIAKYLFV